MPNKNLIDLTGQRFGRLEVLKYNGNSRWECKCDCGKIVYPKGGNLRKGYIHSCGCLRKEVTGDNHRTHGETRTRLYRIWKAMRKRCNNPNDSCYYLDKAGVSRVGGAARARSKFSPGIAKAMAEQWG